MTKRGSSRKKKSLPYPDFSDYTSVACANHKERKECTPLHPGGLNRKEHKEHMKIQSWQPVNTKVVFPITCLTTSGTEAE